MNSIHWLGHSAFHMTTTTGKNLLIDPFLSGNPVTPDTWKSPDNIDYIFLTHGHDDHTADAIPVANRTGAEVVSIVELSSMLIRDGLPKEQAVEMNKGGTLDFGDFKVTMTSANHSSSWKGEYAGDPAGFIFHFDDVRIYHAGDTNILSEFSLYNKIYQPDIAILPIGDHYTMGPAEAAYACSMLKPKYVVPMHYGTMPVLTGTPETFRKLVSEQPELHTQVTVPRAGDDFISAIT